MVLIILNNLIDFIYYIRQKIRILLKSRLSQSYNLYCNLQPYPIIIKLLQTLNSPLVGTYL